MCFYVCVCMCLCVCVCGHFFELGKCLFVCCVLRTFIHMCIYIYIYVCVCVCYTSWLGSILFWCIESHPLVLYTQLLPSFTLIQYFIISTMIVILGCTGDLIESCLKRAAGVKDSGTFFPGHGGVLDRLDSLSLTAPFVYMCAQLWL
eukprot:GHVR01141554.1.p1 GENE.GHVR01141554.1~~GHVR01141554.1.p1  ORF type:complete len:147 (-),score=27.03 GHVR01141554.1:36-476(-)